jgi:hypothetical protein
LLNLRKEPATWHAALSADTQREDEDILSQAIIELASQYGRYGYRRITALLQHAGWQRQRPGRENLTS